MACCCMLPKGLGMLDNKEHANKRPSITQVCSLALVAMLQHATLPLSASAGPASPAVLQGLQDLNILLAYL